MDLDLHELARIAHAFLAPDQCIQDMLPEAQSLRDLLERRARFQPTPEGGIGVGDTRLDSGLAISPTTAAMCIREPYRTSAFIRGLGLAITDALRPDRPVRVLYAGCGPYALLALPLMTLFPKRQAVFTLVDVHRKCLDDAMELISSFGLGGHVNACVCADAAHCRIPADHIPDVIVSETMSVTLHNEPQVSIARNLLTQAPAARMVPQSVRVEACLLDLAREHTMVPAGHIGEIPEPRRDRIDLGPVFELDTAHVHDWKGLLGGRLPAGRVKIPVPLEPRHRPYLLTRIAVYGDVRLGDYETSLTLPKPLPDRFYGGEELRFHYRLGSDPELRYETFIDGEAVHESARSLFRSMRLPTHGDRF